MKITPADAMGYIAALLVFTTFWMKTMVPLRLAGIASNVFFIAYGALLVAYPVLILHVCLLPLNLLRLREMLQLTKRVDEAAAGDHNMAWIKPFTSMRPIQAGDVLFSQGDPADRLFIVVSGRCRLYGSGIEIPPGGVVGELGLPRPTRRARSRSNVRKAENSSRSLTIKSNSSISKIRSSASTSWS
jgi:CRP/FNR family transcriptional regulator, cyclic AMP receptor protein